jgi:aerobic-type carbon monoxide dehydrogenase small subunit (CoxS/CutS family)
MRFTLNGRDVALDLPPDTPLVFALRNDLRLNGPKLGCNRGQCGACTVHLDGVAQRSCMIRLGDVAGHRVTTLEGLGTPERPHPLQAAFIAEQAVQCGYCTNGLIMEAAALIEGKPDITEAEVRAGMDHALCRCGTQPRVVKAVLAAARAGRRA